MDTTRRIATYRHGDQSKTIAVLEVPPVDSPESALKVVIANQIQAVRSKHA
jgi:hypothetical protein